MKIFIAFSFKGSQEQSFFPSDTLIYGISRAGSKNFNIHTCEHMILGQLRMGARQTKNAAKFLTKRIYEIWGGGVGNGTISFVLPSIWAVSFLAWVVSSRLVRFFPTCPDLFSRSIFVAVLLAKAGSASWNPR